MKTISIRLDDTLNDELSDMLDAMGQTKQTFFETYARTALRQRRIPFIIEAPTTTNETSAIASSAFDLPLSGSSALMPTFATILESSQSSTADKTSKTIANNTSSKLQAFERLEAFRKNISHPVDPETERSQAMREKYGLIN